MTNYPPREPHDIIKALVRECGISGRFYLFNCSEEGKFLPGWGTNESGMILTEEGKVYHYWMDWDPEKTAPDGSKGWYTLGENFKNPFTRELHPLFREVTPEEYERVKGYDDYLNARHALGLDDDQQ